jgi:MinD superfamily P-loop ATPase
MYTLCWSVKGGSGTTVVSSALAVVSARANENAVLVDLKGDVPAALGIQEPSGPGVVDWLNSSSNTPAEALNYLMTDVGHGLRLLHRGKGDFIESSRLEAFAEYLEHHPQLCIVDSGTGIPPAVLREHALHSLLITRPCYLALRRATDCASLADGIILITEAGRALSRRDVEAVLQVPVIAEIPVDASVARAVDAGLLAARLPTVISSRLIAVA